MFKSVCFLVFQRFRDVHRFDKRANRKGEWYPPFCQKNIIYFGKRSKKLEQKIRKEEAPASPIHMSEESFYVNYHEGRQGELFAQEYLNQLVSMEASRIIDTSNEKIEGKDFVAYLKDPDTGVSTEKNIEVKTFRGFLFRTNDDEEATGTLGFELWKTKKRKTLGWLPKFLAPDGRKSVQPDILVFLLVAYDRVFASISFLDVPALLDRLKMFSRQNSFNIIAPPVGEDANNFSLSPGLLVENMWLLPFRMLSDLAHVVLIGEKPRIRPIIHAPSRSCQNTTQNWRYEYLQSISKSHIHLLSDERFVFNLDKGYQAITTASKNISFLDSVNWDWFEQLKYMNRSGSFLKVWKGLYQFMLSREYPEREYKGNRYFPISYKTISDWGYQNNIRLQPQTWFNYIKHLLEFGLLKHYQPHKLSTNPVDMAVNKNNPYPRSVEFYSPVELTNNILLLADCKAQDYKHTKRRVASTSRSAIEIQSDLETAKKAYYDNRVLTKKDKYVYETAEQLLISEIDKHDYIRVKEFYSKLWKIIVQKQKLTRIEIVFCEKDAKEQKRYDEYRHAFCIFEKEKKDFIADMMVYKIGPVTKSDKRWLDQVQYGDHIITYKDIPRHYSQKYLKALELEQAAENAKRREKRKAKKHQA